MEQRSREASDAFNHRLGLRSLGDTVALHAGRCDVRAIYLGQPASQPYHIGVCVNAGMTRARGRNSSRAWTGICWCKPDFLRMPGPRDGGAARRHQPRDKRGAARNPWASRAERWTEGIIDYELCRARVSARVPRPAPAGRCKNKGPCLSAPRAWCEAVGGYDEHLLWATGISRNGQDLTARLEIYSGVPSRALPDQFGVHPFHPIELNRVGEVETAIFTAQQDLIDWSRAHAAPTLDVRREMVEEVARRVSGPLAQHLAASYREMEEAPVETE